MAESVKVVLTFEGALNDPAARELMQDLLAAAMQHPSATVVTTQAGQSSRDVTYEQVLDYARVFANPKDVPAAARRLWRAMVRAVRNAQGEEDLDATDTAEDVTLSVASLKVLKKHPEHFAVTRITDATRQRILAFIAEL